jgi:hypothetical protein
MSEISTYKGSREAVARSRVAVAHRQKDPAAIRAARQEHAEAKIAAFIEKTLAKAPPLSGEQRTRLAELLAPVRTS